MSDDGENPIPTPMDHQVDRSVKTPEPVAEKYNRSSEGSHLLADHKEKVGNGEPSKLTSFAMAEVERMLANNLLKPSSKKLDQFSLDFNRKNDLRMRNLSRQMKMVLKRDNFKEMTTGPETNRVRNFDIQSQTLRMVSANAAMANVQFQKTLTLPYMRKSLALGYQKVMLLKEVVTGIGSLEKAVVSKLEAIKLNTAAVIPRKKSYFSKLMDDVRKKNLERVSGNVSNFIMGGWDKRYRRYIAPTTAKLHELMSDATPQGGLNAVRRKVTGKLNSVRRSLKDTASDTTATTGIDKLKVTGAKVGSRLLTAPIKLTQRLRLSDETNLKASTFLKDHTEDLARFNPFAAPGSAPVMLKGDIDPLAGIGDSYKNYKVAAYRLAESFDSWRKEYRSDQDKTHGYLHDIRSAFHGEDPSSPTPKKRSRKKVDSPKTEDVKPPHENITEPVKEKPVRDTPLRSKRKVSDVAPTPTPSPKPIESPWRHKEVPTRNLTSIGESLTKSREAIRKQNEMVKKTISAATTSLNFNPLTHWMEKRKLAAAAPLPHDEHVNMFRSQGNKAPVDRAFFTTMFNRLGSRVSEVTKSVNSGNTARTKFEKIQTKWKALSDKLLGKKVRENSYEDVMSKRNADRPGFMGRAWERTKGLATGVGGNLAAGNVAGALDSAVSNTLSWAKDEAVDYIGDKVTDKVGSKIGRGVRRLKVGGKRSLRNGIRSLKSGGLKGLAKSIFSSGAAEVAEDAGEAVVKKGLLRRGAGLVGRAAMGGTKLLGKGAWSAGKGLLKGGFGLSKGIVKGGAGLLGKGLLKGGAGLLKGGLSLAKGVGPGILVGLAGDYAHDWFSKNTTGGVKRAGNTAASMASWGAAGATIGSVIPGVGTLIGGGIGAAVGGIVENADVIGAGLKKAGSFAVNGLSALGSGVVGLGSGLWTSVFGQKAEFDYMGRVKQREKLSLLGKMKASIFGSDTVYSKSGDIVREGTFGVIPEFKKGFNKFIFGDVDSKGNYKPGSSILSKIGDKVSETMDSFSKALASLADTISQKASSVGGGIANIAKGAYDATANAVSGVANKIGNIFKGGGTPVSDAASIAKQLIPGVTITSYKREAGQAGKAGSNSWHVKSGAAIDVKPVQGMTFEQFKSRFTSAGYNLIEAIDETDPATMKKTGATGPHWHIVLGKPNGQSIGAPGSYAMGEGPLKNGGGSSAFRNTVNYLMTRKGWSNIAATGIAANLFGESSLNPSSFNPKGGGQGAKGIAQWRGSRITDIERRSGKPLQSMSLYEQLDVVDSDLRSGKEVTNASSIQNGTIPITQAINNAPNFESVIQQMVYRYERPGNLAGETQRRIKEAYGIIGKIGTDEPKAPTKQNATPSTPQRTNAPAQRPPAVKPKTPPAKHDSPGWMDSLTSTMSGFTSSITKALGGGDTPATKTPAGGNTTTIYNAPISMGNKVSLANPNTVSMKKSSVRTGM